MHLSVEWWIYLFRMKVATFPSSTMIFVLFPFCLSASLSTCCNLFTSVQLMIEPVPQNPVKGESILLLVHNLPKDLRTFSWYKSFYSTQSFKIAEYRGAMNSITWGPAYSRREIVYINGSLLLQDVTEKDAGFYTLQTLNRDFKTENTHIQFHVYSK